jgi:hypothetical protein
MKAQIRSFPFLLLANSADDERDGQNRYPLSFIINQINKIFFHLLSTNRERKVL